MDPIFVCPPSIWEQKREWVELCEFCSPRRRPLSAPVLKNRFLFILSFQCSGHQPLQRKGGLRCVDGKCGFLAAECLCLSAARTMPRVPELGHSAPSQTRERDRTCEKGSFTDFRPPKILLAPQPHTLCSGFQLATKRCLEDLSSNMI